MWEDSQHYWLVLCKNRWLHLRQNIFYSHKIAPAGTDAVTPLPRLDGCFAPRCDVCGREHRYKPSEVLRYEQNVPKFFTPHPQFGDDHS